MTADLSPIWNEVDLPEERHVIKPFSFTNHLNQAFGSNQLDGNVYVANFFFTSCPSICPKMTSNLKTVADRFNNHSNVALVSFSVMPETDSVSRLKAYHDRFGMRNNWTLLTGDKSEIYTLARQSYFIEERFGLTQSADAFLHTERCVLIDKNRYIRGVYNATVALDMERLSDDINLMLDEA